MKPTAEMVERARVLAHENRLSERYNTAWLAQALADEHERAMKRAAEICRKQVVPVQVHGGGWEPFDDCFYATEAVEKCIAAIRAAAKGE